MICLADHIAYLLVRHDCVIVPGWGAFIASRRPAAIDAASGALMPPGRELSFNAAIAGHDGLLASSVSRREAIPYSRAVEAVAAEVDTLRHQLELHGALMLPRIGTFRSAPGVSTPLFEPLAHGGIVGSPYAALLPVPAQQVDYGRAHHGESPQVAPQVPRRRVPMLARVAAAVAVVVGVGLAALLPATRTGADLASMSPAATARPATLVTDDVQLATELFIAMPDSATATARALRPSAPTATDGRAHHGAPLLASAKTVAISTDDGGYCLVVASLPTRALAERFIAERGDSSLHILASEGRYRVYAAEAPSRAAAVAARPAVAARYPDAWVCAK